MKQEAPTSLGGSSSQVISEKDNDQEVNELIGEIEEHVFRYIKYGTRSNVFNLVEACFH